jgi:hypothetical protein
VWWSKANPGQAVLDIAEATADTDSPVRRMPMLRGGQLHDFPEKGFVETYPEEVPGHIESYGVKDITDAGFLMLDLESGAAVIEDGGDVDLWNSQVVELVKVARGSLPKGIAVGPYPLPHHKEPAIEPLLPGYEGATGCFVAVHTHDHPDRLQQFLERVNEVRGGDPAVCYLWVFGPPTPEQEPGTPPEPDALWSPQGRGEWVTVAQLQARALACMSEIPGVQLVVRGKEDDCARAISIVHDLVK